MATSRRAVLVIGAAALLVTASLLLPYPPTYDPWSWLIWGREVAQLDLDTRAGPVWKPLPVMFTAVFSLAGTAAPALWLLVARAGAVLGVVMAYRLGRRLHSPLAGVAAAAALLTTDELIGYLAPLGMSEPLLAGLVLAAIDRHLAGRRERAFGLLLGAALLRPEAWPFLGAYALVLWRQAARPPTPRVLVPKNPTSEGFRNQRPRGTRTGSPGRLRVLVAAGLLAVPVLWYGPELWGAGDLLRSAHRARVPTEGGPLLQPHPGMAVLASAARYPELWVSVAAVVAAAVALAAYLRRRSAGPVLALALLGGSWVGIVAVMAETRLAAGDRRYLFAAVAVGSVLAGVGFAQAAEAVGALVARVSRRPSGAGPARTGAAVVIAVAAAVSFRPDFAQLRQEGRALRHQTALADDLPAAIASAGGRSAMVACGHQYTGAYLVPLVAWHLRLHLSEVGYDNFQQGAILRAPAEADEAPHPGFTLPELGYQTVARHGLWEVRAACRPGRTLAAR